ncbi:MAG TPA: riboflavin synthase [Chitinophagaceae bacterium]|nr:riboflavin synthase [Chitinophagaceae bacterium]
MFTGIIESKGILVSTRKIRGNLRMTIASGISAALSLDQSVSHNGVCLTVTGVQEGTHQVDVIAETLEKTNLGQWIKGDIINLERAMKLGDRLDGHLVQGHVDCRAACREMVQKKGSLEFRFSYPDRFAGLVIEKGSICVNGISLTAFNVTGSAFTVAIIPNTLEHTNMHSLVLGSEVNIEFDLIGKYILHQVDPFKKHP